MKLPHALGDERGTSTLEFIIVVPVLLLLFLGSLELSRAWLIAHITSNAVREGARLGAVTPPTNVSSVATARINEILGAANLTASAGPAVTCNPAPCAPNSQVVASVTVQFQTSVPLFLPVLEAIDIQQTAIMRYE